MSRQFWYKDAEGNPWSLTIRGRQLFVLTTHGTTFEADAAYLQQAWYQTPDGEWLVLENKEIHWKTALVYLATVVLPWWEDWIHHQYPRAERKGWSYLGELVLSETNRLYAMLISLALHVRTNQGLPPLWTIGGMSEEAQGDVIEGILGLSYMAHPLLGDGLSRSRITRWVLASILGLVRCWNMPNYRDVWDPLHLRAEFVDSTLLDNFWIDVPPPNHEAADHARYHAIDTPKINKRNAEVLVVSALLQNGLGRKRHLVNYVMEFVG